MPTRCRSSRSATRSSSCAVTACCSTAISPGFTASRRASSTKPLSVTPSASRTISASRSQSVTLKPGRGQNIKFLPYAFTEHGAIMAATVLNSSRAVEMSIYVVRAFVQLRELISSNKDLARRLDQLEARIEKKLVTHDDAIAAMLSAIRQLMNPPPPKRRPIGFTANLDEK